VSKGASAQGGFTVSWVDLGMLRRAGAPAGFPNLLTSPPRSNPANHPVSHTMPQCRFNKYNTTSSARLLALLSTPFISPTTASSFPVAHECASCTLLKVVTFCGFL